MCTPQLRDAVQQAILPKILGKGDTNVLIQNATTVDPQDPSALPSHLSEWRDAETVEYQTNNGVLVIPVHGILTTRRGSYDAECSEVTSYEKLSGLLDAALDSDAVKHIVYDINSNGGSAIGCFDFAERIYQARSIKPSTAIINYSAYSAAYALASAADEIVVSTTSGVGSIGVIATHVDMSKALDEAGLVMTSFYRGYHKNDLSPYEAVTKEAAAELDDLYDLFVQTVARNRNLKPKEIQTTEAKTYRGAKAIEIGLADRLAYPQDAANSIMQTVLEQHPPKMPISTQAAAMAMEAQL